MYGTASTIDVKSKFTFVELCKLWDGDGTNKGLKRYCTIITYVKINVQATPRAEENLKAESFLGIESGKKMNTVKIVIQENLPVWLFLR